MGSPKQTRIAVFPLCQAYLGVHRNARVGNEPGWSERNVNGCECVGLGTCTSRKVAIRTSCLHYRGKHDASTQQLVLPLIFGSGDTAPRGAIANSKGQDVPASLLPQPLSSFR